MSETADELQKKLDFLKSKGLTVGLMKEAGKEPYLTYVIKNGSELCDLETINRLIDVELENTRLVEALRDARRELGNYTSNCVGGKNYSVIDCIKDIDKALQGKENGGHSTVHLPARRRNYRG